MKKPPSPSPRRPLRARLAEAEETLRAIRGREADALVVSSPDVDRVFTLQGADRTYRFLVEEMNEGALLLEPGGTVMHANARFAEMAGVPLEQVSGGPWERWFATEARAGLARLLREAKSGPVRGKFELSGGGGTKRPVSVSLCSIQRDRVQGLCAVVTDLTERKAAGAYNRSLIETSLDPLVTIGPDGKITDLNEATELATGYDRAALLRRARGDGCREEFLLGQQAGTSVPVELSMSFLSGTPAETFSAIVTDLTERKLAQDALHQAISELEHFSFTVVHDLRGPLRVMQSFAAIIEEECTGCQARRSLDYIRRINVAAKRMDQLITDSLNYSKAARTELKLEPVELSPLIDDLVHTYPNLLPDKANIQLALDLPPVMGNKTALTQCFSNLLGNAVKFAKSGTKPQIRVWGEIPSHSAIDPSIHAPRQTVRVWVEDQGMGIPKGAQKDLFVMFKRANTEREGTGVGLAIVRKVVERMGGRVGVESEEGHGSRFWVELLAAPQNWSMLRSGHVPNSGGKSS